jgi:hypothetical protein
MLGLGIVLLVFSLALAFEPRLLPDVTPVVAYVGIAVASGSLCAIGAGSIWQRGSKPIVGIAAAALYAGVALVAYTFLAVFLAPPCVPNLGGPTSCLANSNLLEVVGALGLWLAFWGTAAGIAVAVRAAGRRRTHRSKDASGRSPSLP